MQTSWSRCAGPIRSRAALYSTRYGRPIGTYFLRGASTQSVLGGAYPKTVVKRADQRLTNSSLARFFELPHVRVVVVPESRVRVVLYGSDHQSTEDASLIQDFIPQLGPDQVCLELCEERYKQAMNGGLRAQLMNASRTLNFSRKMKGRGGGDMILAALEAARLGCGTGPEQPVNLIDRRESVTFLRLAKELPRKALFCLFAPQLAVRLAEWRLQREASRWESRGHGRVVSLNHLVTSFFPLTQVGVKERKAVLSHARCISSSEQTYVVPAELFRADRDIEPASGVDLNDEVLRSSSIKAKAIDSDSLVDVMDRVLKSERDAVLALHIRRQTGPGSWPGARGPLVLAVLGSTHLAGVADHLAEPLSHLEEYAASFLEAPAIPWYSWRRWIPLKSRLA